MTFLELQTNVRVWVTENPNITLDMIKSAINTEYLELALPFYFRKTRTQSQVGTIAGLSSVSLAPLITGGLNIATVLAVKNDTDNYTLKHVDDAEFIASLDETESGESEYWWLLEGPTASPGIQLWPVPDAAVTLRIWVVIYPTPMVGDDDIPIYPPDWHRVIELGAASELCAMFNMNERSQMTMNKKLSLISSRQEIRTIERRAFQGANARPIRTRFDARRSPYGED